MNCFHMILFRYVDLYSYLVAEILPKYLLWSPPEACPCESYLNCILSRQGIWHADETKVNSLQRCKFLDQYAAIELQKHLYLKWYNEARYFLNKVETLSFNQTDRLTEWSIDWTTYRPTDRLTNRSTTCSWPSDGLTIKLEVDNGWTYK